ncbi:oxidoreductase [Mesorhizobium sp. BAC0120]|uniref:oxidoreductase n=1 Tax=Mesorhizobium sp. BAC0120 TaxID=3090670 RepID=UPI00298D2A10|nr:oxidoreductase [Mesorhizobium sp. BAC0120]MDW6024267.1 oxidoreductase [Mesorhizobium sp. BAC0120]
MNTTPQRPIGSGFGAASTAAEVIAGHDLSGRTAIVTGGYAGIGLETVRVLRAAGARVVVPARDLAKARQALNDMPDVEIARLDLMTPESIDAFAEGFLRSGLPLHLLINNAGIMANPLTRDSRGFESQFSTNHLGHFQLTTRLWPALVQGKGARIVNVSSQGHFLSPVVSDDINFERRAYDPWAAYGQSKTANALFAVEADARGAAQGIRAFAVHPGSIVDSDLKRFLSKDDLKATGTLDEDGKAIIDPSRNRKTIAQGAATTVWCATSLQLNGMGGVYCENCDIAEQVPAELIAGAADGSALNFPTGVMPYALDPNAARRLWQMSELMLRSRVESFA